MIRKTNIYDGRRFDFATHINEFLILREDTKATEAFLVIVEPDKCTHMHSHADFEQVFFVVNGEGRIVSSDSDETVYIAKDDLVFIPSDQSHQIFCVGPKPLCYLVFNGFLSRLTCQPTSYDHAVSVVNETRTPASTAENELKPPWRRPILVAGSSGFVGSALVNYYLTRRATVWGYDQLPPPHQLKTVPLFHGREIDLLDEQQLISSITSDCHDNNTTPSLLIASAGLTNSKHSFLDTDAELLMSQINHNFVANFNIARAYSRLLIEEGQRGTIVFIGSVGASKAHRNQCVYDATKAAIEGLTRAIALELAPKGINVNTVAIGPLSNSPSSLADREMVEALHELVPIRRYGDPQEVADIISSLAAINSPFFTGQTIIIDGGLSIQLRPSSLEMEN